MSNSNDWIVPQWSAPAQVRALSTTRTGGFSQGEFAGLNLGDHVQDDAATVQRNRDYLQQELQLSNAPRWLKQVHGDRLLCLEQNDEVMPEADASYTRQRAQVCVVMTADCLPVLFTDAQGSFVMAVHAGWRGLHNGIISKSLRQLGAPRQLLAWIGPAICGNCFEVGAEVHQAFCAQQAVYADFFKPSQLQGHYFMDPVAIAQAQILAQCPDAQVSLSQCCSFEDSQRFFSYRRDGQCGRMASLIWLADAA